jgi:hypothetical protein
MPKCNSAAVIAALVVLNGFVLIALAWLAYALIANVSVIGSAGATSLVLLGAATLAATGAPHVAFYFLLDKWWTCALVAVGPMSECANLYKSLTQLWATLGVALATATVACIVGAIPAAVPWWGTAVIITLGLLCGAILVMLALVDTWYGLLRACVARKAEERGVSPSPLVPLPSPGAYMVLTCPLNKSVCADGDLQQATRTAAGVYTTSPSFALVLAPPATGTIASVTADVVDGFSRKALVSARDILPPNTHSIGDKSRWAVRLDWAKLSTAGIRVEPRNRDWAVNVHTTRTDGTTDHVVFHAHINV